MVRLLCDENFNGDIVRALRLRQPTVDLLWVQDTELSEADDPTILAWAAQQDRIVLTHDRATMPDFAYQRIVAGLTMRGLFVVHDRMAIQQVVQELLLIDECSMQDEWCNKVIYFPFL